MRIPLPITGDTQADNNMRCLFFFTIAMILGIMLTLRISRPTENVELNTEARFLMICNQRLPCPDLGPAGEKQMEAEAHTVSDN